MNPGHTDWDTWAVLADNAAARGDLARSTGCPAEAMRCYRESLAIMQGVVGETVSPALPSRKCIALLMKLGDMETRCGQTVAARGHYLDAAAALRPLMREGGMHRARRRLAACLRRLGDIAKAGCDYHTAREHYSEALAVMRLSRGKHAAPEACVVLIKWLKLAADAEHVLQHYDDALSLYKEMMACHDNARTHLDSVHTIRSRVRCCQRISSCLGAIARHTESFDVTDRHLHDADSLEAICGGHIISLRTCRAFWIARGTAARALNKADEAAIASRHSARLRARIAARPGPE